MYNLMPLIFGSMMFVLGLIMVINPKGSTKKEFQNNENMIAKTKKNGYVVIVCGFIVIIIGIMSFF